MVTDKAERKRKVLAIIRDERNDHLSDIQVAKLCDTSRHFVTLARLEEGNRNLSRYRHS